MLLKRTGKLIKFLDLMIGNVFYYGDRFYTRTGYEMAVELKGSRWMDGRACNFLVDEMKDELIEEVQLEKAS